MMREGVFYKILSAVHIVFFTSILSFLTITLSGTLLLLPAFGAVFMVGKAVIYKQININDSIIKTYCKYLAHSLKLMKYLPAHFIAVLNAAGMIVSAKAGNLVYSVLCLAILSFTLALMMYLTGYFVFIQDKVNIIEVIFIMFLKAQYFIPVFAAIVLSVFFFSGTVLVVFAFCGTFFLIALESVVFIQILHYKKEAGILDEKEEFAYLVEPEHVPAK